MLRQARPLFAFDLGDTDAARAIAQRIADKTGREVKVTNEHGGEVCTVLPTPPAQRVQGSAEKLSRATRRPVSSTTVISAGAGNEPLESLWRIGVRVSRRDTDELGTVVAHHGKIKVKWDGGKTSYYGHGERANVELLPLTE